MGDVPAINNFLKNMMVLNDNRTKRISSWDQTGGNRDCLTLAPGETQTIFDVEGPAIINHFYVTMMSRDLFAYRRVIVRMFWDEEETPSVECPIGDLFCVPFSQPVFFASQVASVCPGRDRMSTDGINLYFPMPFAKHGRIELFNDSELMLQNFWYHVNYEEVEALEPGLGYFHACWRRDALREIPDCVVEENMNLSSGINLTGEHNYVILDAVGQGNYVGCNLQVDNLKPGWYGEGDDMIFIDGEKWPPSLHGTGTEEIFGGGACPNEAYFTNYCGFHVVERKDFYGRNAMYKFFVTDPVRFKKSIRVTIEAGHANNLANDYASAAYWYQTEPHGPRRPLPPGQEHAARVPPGFEDVVAMSEEAGKLYYPLNKEGKIGREAQMKLRGGFMEMKKAFWARDVSAALLGAKEYLEAIKAVEKRAKK
jgi:hypothetical protein